MIAILLQVPFYLPLHKPLQAGIQRTNDSVRTAGSRSQKSINEMRSLLGQRETRTVFAG